MGFCNKKCVVITIEINIESSHTMIRHKVSTPLSRGSNALSVSLARGSFDSRVSFPGEVCI